MSAADYFLSRDADKADLSAWAPILPTTARPLRTNLFGDAFVIDDQGAVHVLERAGCCSERIAASEEEFWRQLQSDSSGWQLRHLADECRGAGMILEKGQCYAYTTLPVLGGAYEVSNIWVAPWAEWFALMADVFQQIKDLPNGAALQVRIIE